MMRLDALMQEMGELLGGNAAQCSSDRWVMENAVRTLRATMVERDTYRGVLEDTRAALDVPAEAHIVHYAKELRKRLDALQVESDNWRECYNVMVALNRELVEGSEPLVVRRAERLDGGE